VSDEGEHLGPPDRGLGHWTNTPTLVNKSLMLQIPYKNTGIWKDKIQDRTGKENESKKTTVIGQQKNKANSVQAIPASIIYYA
jgi:hypothetical protein